MIRDPLRHETEILLVHLKNGGLLQDREMPLRNTTLGLCITAEKVFSKTMSTHILCGILWLPKGAENASGNRDIMAKEMTPVDISKVQQLAR